jgi:hypothetical protein
MRILYLSLLPENNNCNEIRNLKYFIDSTKYYNIDELFTYRLFTCHEKMQELIKNTYSLEGTSLFNLDHNLHIEKLNFEYTEEMDERRAHEIAFAKQKIFIYSMFKNTVEQFDYIFYNDADIKIDSKDVYELCQILEVKNKQEQLHFANIPYVIKLTKKVVYDSFGSYILPTKILPYMESAIKDIYTTFINDDSKVCRRYAPDWVLRQSLLRTSFQEIRAESCNTKHYLNNEEYYEFDSTKVNFS